MTKRVWALVYAPLTITAIVLLMAAANGAWLKKVPASDRAAVNPVAAQPDAIAAGSNLYQNNCAQCHGADGNGRAMPTPRERSEW
jgi:mono/diheme cytochrome c family protein